jgi:hypothetical protein
MTLRFLSVDTRKLKGSSFNPVSRYAKQATTMAELVADIKKVGVLSPLMVVPVGGGHYQVADGHRRWTAATIAGLETVPCVVIEGLTLGEVYRRQFITRRPSGQEVLQVYLLAPDAVAPRQRRMLERYETIFGRERLNAFSEAGASLNTFLVIRALDRYLAGNVPVHMKYGPAGMSERMAELADWLIGQRQQGSAWKAIAVRFDARTLWQTIRRNEKLTFQPAP